jgi:hypothetical protein
MELAVDLPPIPFGVPHEFLQASGKQLIEAVRASFCASPI